MLLSSAKVSMLLDEGGADRFHERRRHHGLLAMVAKEGDDAAVVLQFRLVDVEVHAVDAFDFKRDVITNDFGNAARYTHGRLRLTSVPSGPPPHRGKKEVASATSLRLNRSLFYSTRPK